MLNPLQISSSLGLWRGKLPIMAESGGFFFDPSWLLAQVDVDFETEPLGTGKDGKKVFFRDIWPSNEEIASVSPSPTL